jgi:cytochrome c6
MLWQCSAADGSEKELETTKTGQQIFQIQCAICHGNDGRKGLAGAKMIPESILTLEERVALITAGKGSMMPYRDILNEEEIKRVAEYTFTLK